MKSVSPGQRAFPEAQAPLTGGVSAVASRRARPSLPPLSRSGLPRGVMTPLIPRDTPPLFSLLIHVIKAVIPRDTPTLGASYPQGVTLSMTPRDTRDTPSPDPFLAVAREGVSAS